MGDRVRIGELLAGIGTLSLVLLLGFADWFTADFTAVLQGTAAGAAIKGSVALGTGQLGWFAFALVLAAIVSGFVLVARVLTGDGPERAMLQAPISFLFSFLALLALLVRFLLWQPGVSIAQVENVLGGRLRLSALNADVHVALGGWLGILALLAILVGSWVSFHDERTGSAAAKKRTAELLANVKVRPAPPVGKTPDTEAAVVADDAAPDDDLPGADPTAADFPIPENPNDR